MDLVARLDAEFAERASPGFRAGPHRSGIGAFRKFAAAVGTDVAWPITALCLRRFVAFLGGAGYSKNTIEQYVSAVQLLAQCVGGATGPIRDAARSRAIASYGRGRGRVPARALTPAAVLAIVHRSRAGMRVYVAMLLLQLFTLARAESVTGGRRWKTLLCGDLRAGSDGVLVRLHDWKHGAGRESWELLPELEDSPLCPVQALALFVGERPRAAAGSEPLFVDVEGRPVSYVSYLRWLRAEGQAVGVQGVIGTNSVRRTAAGILDYLRRDAGILDAAAVSAAGRWREAPATYFNDDTRRAIARCVGAWSHPGASAG